ncbi:hypothetical protein DFH08DRAFT_806329 [Mycena albidolilacea]|uniref:Uncharacterized protein n=1 Tax=Mycena albidolilacea TaxID=1033008 RepID=A0AAD7A8V5_9AGAR|nr:hypothetical protein DFH08DRAFT_806329 [Mycena albidolilacea]
MQRVERIKKGWGNVRISTDKCRTVPHDLHHTCKCPLRIASGTEACKREPPKFRIATIEKTRKEKTQLQNNCPLPPQCVALAGVRGGATEKRTDIGTVVPESKPRVVVLIEQTARRSPHSAVLELQARLRVQRRDSRAAVLVMMEEEVALEVAQDPTEEERERARRSGGAGGRKGDACGAQTRRSGAKAAPRTRSRRWRESTVGVRRGTGEEAKKGGQRGPGLGRETQSGWWRGKDGASTNTKIGSSVDKKEE